MPIPLPERPRTPHRSHRRAARWTIRAVVLSFALAAGSGGVPVHEGFGAGASLHAAEGASAENQGWEIRLIATEGALSSEPDVITITVQRPPD